MQQKNVLQCSLLKKNIQTAHIKVLKEYESCSDEDVDELENNLSAFENDNSVQDSENSDESSELEDFDLENDLKSS